MIRTSWSNLYCWLQHQTGAAPLARHAPSARRRGFRYSSCSEVLECRRVLSATADFMMAIPLELNRDQPQVGLLNETPTSYAFNVDADGRLVVDVEATAGAARLTLLSAEGDVLVQSDGRSPHAANGRLDLHLVGSSEGTSYFLRVESLGDSAGSFVLTTHYSATTTAFEPMAVGVEPWSSVAADLNADGIVDIAVANFDSSDVSIFLGEGDGTFGLPELFGIGSGANYIVASDFNADGRLDLATANMESSTVSILLGIGDGTFETVSDYAAGDTASGLTADDFNGDGAVDLAVAAFGANVVTILLNDGSGVFAEPVEYAVGTNPYLIASGDFNGDGLPDLAAPNYESNDVSILLGNGDGTFTFAPTLVAGGQPYAPTIQDFNDDGKLDLAVTNYSSNDVSLFMGNGDGTFAEQTLLAAGSGTTAIETADFNDDGRLDLIAANLSDATLSLFLGHDDGTFEAQQTFAAGTSPSSVTVADFNRDGLIDVGFTDLTANEVSVLLGRGNASFLTEPAQSSATKIFQIATADFNGDGRLDLASANYSTSDVSILLGNQDGTFQFGGRFAIGSDVTAIAAGDVNRDGVQDLVVSNYGTADIAVLLGVGDGTFGEPELFAAGNVPYGLVVADFNDDLILDVVTVNTGDAQVAVLIGDGTGQFGEPATFAVDAGASHLTAADFNQDGRLDLAVSNQEAGSVSILLSVGDGAFAPQLQLETELNPTGVAAGDFDGDGMLDVAVANSGSGSVSVFLSDGSGGFGSSLTFLTGTEPLSVLVGDFNHDQKTDLATVDRATQFVTIHAGQGDGTFQSIAQVSVGASGYHAVLGDFNDDGNWDIATANESSDVSVLLGQADGAFQAPMPIAIAGGPSGIAAADFNNDGQSDFVTVAPSTQTLTVTLGQGDGTSLAPIMTTLEGEPVAVVTGDFNNDGRSDAAVASFQSNSVSILLGIGDGTFETPVTLPVGVHPVALVTGDFNHDDLLDLATSDFGSGTVSVLLGRADGTFEDAQAFEVGDGPTSLAVSDLNHDGLFDLVVSNSWSRDLTLLMGDGAGGFESAGVLALEATPGAVGTGDFDSDGQLDIAVTHSANNSVSILWGTSDGTFQLPFELAVGLAPVALIVGDFNSDGRADIATGNSNSNDVTVLLPEDDGTFSVQTHVDDGRFPSALVAGDFNNDGRLDLAIANGLGEPVSVGLGLGNGEFIEPGASSPIIQSRPLVADFSGDGVLDVVVLRNDGRLLFRNGTAAGVFETPEEINPAADGAVRDLAILNSNGHALLVAINMQSNTIAIYRHVAGHFRQIGEQVTVAGVLPSRIQTGDVNGDGRVDVVVLSAASGTAFVYLQREHDKVRSRDPSYQIEVGPGASDAVLVDVTGDGLPELVVTDQVSGDVRVLLNSDDAPFESQLRFRSGSGVTSLEADDGPLLVESRDAPIAVVTGLFNDDAYPALAVLNAGVNRVDVLLGNGVGGFFNPSAETSLLTGLDPVAIVAADWNDDGRLDLAVLNQGSNDVSVFLNDGNANFTEALLTDSAGRTIRSSAGNSPTGLSAGDIDGDGVVGLLIGNTQGDVLTLVGNGDGTFRPYQRIDQHVGLAITGLNSADGPAFAVSDQSLDRVTFVSQDAGSTFEQGREDGLLAPSSVTFADLNQDDIDDLIVSSTGSNAVFVYLGQGGDQFDLGHRFAVGTSPEAITVGDVNGDGLADLVVANHGSNDLSLLFGQGQGTDWTLLAGPRLRAGSGPAGTAIDDINADGIADIVVVNHHSNDVYFLAGLGRGFFNDRQPTVVPTGDGPEQLFVGHFDNSDRQDVVTVNSDSNDLTVISGLGSSDPVLTRTVSLRGIEPVAAIAQDVNHDGLSDLIVADQSGRFALWLGGSDDVRLIDARGSGRVTNISDLVLGRVTSNSVEVYFTSAGNSMATLATLVFDFNSAPSTNGGFTATFAPLPDVLPALSSQASLGNVFTTIIDEGGSFDFFGHAAGFTALPTTLFNPGYSISEPGLNAAEFSSPSGSSLEVIATLVLGLQQSNAATLVEDDEDDEGMAVAAPASDRDLLVTGVAQTPILKLLQDSSSDDAATAILFSSPLDLFDDSGSVATTRPKPDLPVTRAAPVRKQELPVRFLKNAARQSAVDPAANSQTEQPVAPKTPLPSNENQPRASQPLDRLDPKSELPLDVRESASLGLPRLVAIVACAASIVSLGRGIHKQRTGRRRLVGRKL